MAKARKKKNQRQYVFDALTVAAAMLFAVAMTMAQVEASRFAQAHSAPHQAFVKTGWQCEIETGCRAVAAGSGKTLARARFLVRTL